MKKVSGLMMAVMVLSLVACGSSERRTQEVQIPTDSNAEAEYQEKEVAYPEGTVFYSSLNQDGVPIVWMFDSEKGSSTQAAYQEYIFKAGAWEKQNADYLNKALEEKKVPSLFSIETDINGGLYTILSSKDGKTSIYQVTDSTMKKCKNILMQGSNNSYACQFIGEDKACVLYVDGDVCIRNIKDGSTVKDFGDDFTTMQVLDNSIYAMNKEHNQIREIGLLNGETGATYDYELTNQGISFCKDDEENVYACTEEGIYLLGDKGKLEEVVAGDKMTTNAMSTEARIDSFSVVDDTFYVTYLISGDNSRNYRMVSYSKK